MDVLCPLDCSIDDTARGNGSKLDSLFEGEETVTPSMLMRMLR